MESTNKIIGGILVAAVLVGAGYMGLNRQSDRAKFDDLRMGMTIEDIEDTVCPRTATYTHIEKETGDEETLLINDVMSLKLRDGVLVEKKWIGKEESR
jgi:hypothetical protein